MIEINHFKVFILCMIMWHDVVDLTIMDDVSFDN
jgi:hypothetical protein